MKMHNEGIDKQTCEIIKHGNKKACQKEKIIVVKNFENFGGFSTYFKILNLKKKYYSEGHNLN